MEFSCSWKGKSQESTYRIWRRVQGLIWQMNALCSPSNSLTFLAAFTFRLYRVREQSFWGSYWCCAMVGGWGFCTQDGQDGNAGYALQSFLTKEDKRHRIKLVLCRQGMPFLPFSSTQGTVYSQVIQFQDCNHPEREAFFSKLQEGDLWARNRTWAGAISASFS